MTEHKSQNHDTRELDPMVTRAYLVGIERGSAGSDAPLALLDELQELVSNLGIEVVHRNVVRIRKPQAAYLMGKGKMESVIEDARSRACDVIVFDDELTPGQQRNWEKSALDNILVIDRQEVILDIFNRRAQTREASLQVELARLEYELPRMRRAWSHLDRQRGGGAMQRDAGETQLEIDQRLIRTRIARLKRELSSVVRTRATQRKQRERLPVPTAAIVGYTNAGKSSLLNRLTNAAVIAEDKLFATLDPTTRRTRLPSGQTLLLTDTVGFVRRLPHRLIEAFKATLEEAVVADFLIHVVDASSLEAEAHFHTTRDVLRELGAESARILTVFNKSDLAITPAQMSGLRALEPEGIFVSAHTGVGLPLLLSRCEDMVKDHAVPVRLLIPHDRYDLVGKLHRAGAVSSERAMDEGVLICGHLPLRLLDSYRPYSSPPPANG